MPAERCSTSSGAFRCDYSAGHAGECETTAGSRPFAGAMALAYRAGGQDARRASSLEAAQILAAHMARPDALQYIGAGANPLESPRPAPTLSPDALSATGSTSEPSGATEARGAAPNAADSLSATGAQNREGKSPKAPRGVGQRVGRSASEVAR